MIKIADRPSSQYRTIIQNDINRVIQEREKNKQNIKHHAVINVRRRRRSCIHYLNGFARRNPNDINKITPKQALPAISFHDIMEHLSGGMVTIPHHHKSSYSLQRCHSSARHSPSYCPTKQPSQWRAFYLKPQWKTTLSFLSINPFFNNLIFSLVLDEQFIEGKFCVTIVARIRRLTRLHTNPHSHLTNTGKQASELVAPIFGLKPQATDREKPITFLIKHLDFPPTHQGHLWFVTKVTFFFLVGVHGDCHSQSRFHGDCEIVILRQNRKKKVDMKSGNMNEDVIV